MTEGIVALKDIIKDYQSKGLIYEDFLVGIKGFYAECHPYSKYALPKYKEGISLDVPKLKGDLQESGYKTVRDIWDEQAERIATANAV